MTKTYDEMLHLFVGIEKFILRVSGCKQENEREYLGKFPFDYKSEIPLEVFRN